MVRKRERKRVRERRRQNQRQRFSLAIAVEAAPRASPPQYVSVIDLCGIFLYHCRTKAYALDATFFLPIAQRENSLHLAVAVASFHVEGAFIYLYLLYIYL
jgi:hypothetical protein